MVQIHPAVPVKSITYMESEQPKPIKLVGRGNARGNIPRQAKLRRLGLPQLPDSLTALNS